MVLTYDAYDETLENQKEKESEVQRLQQKHPQCSNHFQHPRSQQSHKIIIKGGEDQKNALRKGDVGIKKIYGQLRREDRDELIQKARLAPPIVQLPHNNQLKQSGNANVQLYHSDFRLLTEQQITPETVDLIFTEPPDD